MPAVWMRPSGRNIDIEEARILAQIFGFDASILMWRTRRLSPSPDVFNGALGKFQWLRDHRIVHFEVIANTGIGIDDLPGYIDLADGTDCDHEEFDRFVSESTFGKLSGIVFGSARSASSCLSVFESYLKEWHKGSREDGEIGLLNWIRGMQSLSLNPAISITDSNMRTYYAIPKVDSASSRKTLNPKMLATKEEFTGWSRIGWDIKSLQRSFEFDKSR
jgi:hypothetical protein